MEQILFRKDNDNQDEYIVATKFFDVTSVRTNVNKNNTIIGRYSVLPFYPELELDLRNYNCKLVNSYKQHNWIANFDWYDDLKDFTPRSYFDHNFNEAPDEKYVVKGKTNSRKFEWNKKMFAQDKRQASFIAAELMQDPLIGSQGVVYRQYVPLETFEVGLNDLPFTNEWRFFIYKTYILSWGYYWSNAEFYPSEIETSGINLVNEIVDIAKDFANFYVLDIAKTQSGNWILIEVNDGQMSGLSNNNPFELYHNLREVMKLKS